MSVPVRRAAASMRFRALRSLLSWAINCAQSIPSTFSLSGADENPIMAGSIAWHAVAGSIASIIAAIVQVLRFTVIVLSIGCANVCFGLWPAETDWMGCVSPGCRTWAARGCGKLDQEFSLQIFCDLFRSLGNQHERDKKLPLLVYAIYNPAYLRWGCGYVGEG